MIHLHSNAPLPSSPPSRSPTAVWNGNVLPAREFELHDEGIEGVYGCGKRPDLLSLLPLTLHSSLANSTLIVSAHWIAPR